MEKGSFKLDFDFTLSQSMFRSHEQARLMQNRPLLAGAFFAQTAMGVSVRVA